MIGFLFLGASFWTFAGYVTAWVDSRTPLVSAMAFMGVLLLLSIVTNAVATGPGAGPRFPLWYRLAVSTVNIIAMMAGAIIRVHRSGAPVQSL